MALEQMFPGIPFSPLTTLVNNIGAGETNIEVSDVSAFPDAPNFATIGIDETAETILYNSKTSNSLSGCIRGVEGTARSWVADSPIARNFTNEDYARLVSNINKLIVKGEIGNADEIVFDDGETFQEKLDSGTLRGQQGVQGEQGIQGIRGEQGIQGVKGDAGNTGSQGIQGLTGKSIEYVWDGSRLGIRQEGQAQYSYSDLKGAQGEQGIQGATGATGNTGATGAQGVQGVQGSVWLSGAGTPSSGLGRVGDWYMNTANSDAYEKTSSTAWTLRGNLKGATGATGAQGVQGIPGIDGTNGKIPYGVSYTSETIAAKTVTVDTDFVWQAGAIVVVYFSGNSWNTASNPTLNVNGTGAKSIYVRGILVKPYQLKSRIPHMFQYFYGDEFINGYELVNPYEVTSVLRGNCTTQSATSAKVVSVPGFTSYDNEIVSVSFDYDNTASNPALSINSTNPFPITQSNGSPVKVGQITYGRQHLFQYFRGVGVGNERYILLNPTEIIPPNRIFHGTCTTAASTATKVVNLQNITSGMALSNFPMLFVTFTNANTVTGNISLQIQGVTTTTVNKGGRAIAAGTTCVFVYDGSSWQQAS